MQLSGATSAQPVTVEIPEAKIKQTVTTDAAGRAEFHFPAKLELWSPEHPRLYDVVVSSGADKVHDAIGFRTIETRGTQILLNGKPIFLRGISLHEEAPVRGGRAFSQKDAETLLGWARELGCNFVRLTHYPHSENMTRLADRMGIMVWSEIPVYWDIDWENPATLQNAESQLHEMIARDHNRASVVLWSLSNETPVKPARTTFLRQLADAARQQDSTRLITSALNHVDEAGPDTRALNDPVGEYLDVLGLNEYLGWYGGRPEDADRMQWKFAWDKPVIVSEFGAGAPYGRHGEADERWTEEYQANLYQHQITMLKKIPVAGRFIALGAHGLPLAAPPAAWRSGLLQPQRTDFEYGTAQAGVLRAAEVLSGDGSRQVATASIQCRIIGEVWEGHGFSRATKVWKETRL